jgi:hypothetical protein
MTEQREPTHGSNGSKLLTVDTLIKILLLMVALVLSYQKVQDRQDFLDSRVKDIELWRDTERQLVIALEHRLTVQETNGIPSRDANTITLQQRR